MLTLQINSCNSIRAQIITFKNINSGQGLVQQMVRNPYYFRGQLIFYHYFQTYRQCYNNIMAMLLNSQLEFQYRIRRVKEDHPLPPLFSKKQQVQTTREERQQYQHQNMLRQDYYALFYRNINTIIQLEALQQTQVQVENQINQLSPTHRAQDYLATNRFSEESEDKVSPVIITAKEAAKYHSRLRRQEGLHRKKIEFQVQIEQLRHSRKGVVQIVRSLTMKWMEAAFKLFDNQECSQLQERLLEAGKKYNLSKVISNFMGELKNILIVNWAIEMLTEMSGSQSGLKVQQLKLSTGRGQKQTIANLTLYLKEFYSSNIFKQLNELISSLPLRYQASRAIRSIVLDGLKAQIENTLAELTSLARTIASRQGMAMDLKIDIEIISEEIKLIEKRLWSCQHDMESFIKKQATILLQEYHCTRQYEKVISSGDSTISNTNIASNTFHYFYHELTTRYKKFMLQHLKRSQQIEYLQFQIEQNNMMIRLREQEINYQKGLNYHPGAHSLQLEDNLDDRADKHKLILQLHQSIQEEPVQSLEEEDTYEMPLQTFRGNQQHSQQLIIKDHHQQSNAPAESLEQTPTLKGCQDNKQNQIFPRVNSFYKPNIKRQRFIVRKSLIIGSSKSKNLNFGDKDAYRQFQVKLTKKFLIIQPLDEQTLSICEKIELSRIKSFVLNLQKKEIKLDYGGCVLQLYFITFNLDSFVKKLTKLGIKADYNQKVKQR